MIVCQPDNLVLESDESILSFPVEHRHVDVEKTHEGVCHVLRSRSLSIIGPGHLHTNADIL